MARQYFVLFIVSILISARYALRIFPLDGTPILLTSTFSVKPSSALSIGEVQDFPLYAPEQVIVQETKALDYHNYQHSFQPYANLPFTKELSIFLAPNYVSPTPYLSTNEPIFPVRTNIIPEQVLSTNEPTVIIKPSSVRHSIILETADLQAINEFYQDQSPIDNVA